MDELKRYGGAYYEVEKIIDIAELIKWALSSIVDFIEKNKTLT